MIFVVTGKLGSGKSLITVGRIYDALKAGRKVATNLDLRLEHLTVGKAPTTCIRLPDYPNVRDLEALGPGNLSPDESLNGVIVLDEGGKFLNARGWQAKAQQQVIDWMIESRKTGWDIYLIAQHQNLIDAQIRSALAEHLVVCTRLDRVPIPIIGWVLKSIGFSGKFLRLHLATVRLGLGANAIITDRWLYKGKRFWQAYDTRQRFRPQRSPLLSDEKGNPLKDENGVVIPDDNPQGPYQFLDLYRAPWLRRPSGWREKYASRWVESPRALVRALGFKLLPERGSWFDAWLCETFGPPRYTPPPMTYADWKTSRAPQGGALGGEAGEAPEPEREERSTQPAFA